VIDSENREEPIKIGDYSLFRYTGQSPDEITLIEAASSLGFQFVGVERGIAKLKLFNLIIIEFEILYNFEFDSDRKRSTVIVKHQD
jgi:phospholipid-translocating ATPase/phospholipid-transporting ATPase